MKTFGYGLQAFAGGFQTGLGLGMERKKIKMIQDEQKRAEKLAKEKEENAMNWYNANKDSLTNFHTQSQDARSKLIFESVQYKKEWTDYLRDVEDFLQSGDLEGLKSLNDMEEERIKAERDMLGIGVRPENAFVGKYYSEESMEYAKKLQMGKLANKPIGTQMYEEQFGKLPVTPEAPKTELDIMGETGKKLDYAYATGNASHFNQMAKSLGVDTTFETYKKGHKEPEIPKEEPTPAPTSTENIREDILNADTFKDAERIYKNYADKYDETALGIDDVDKFWSDERVRRLDTIKNAIENLLVDRGDKGRWLKPGTITSAEVGLSIEGDEQNTEAVYKQLRADYIKFRDMLEKMGVDVSQYPKLKPLSEIEKVGGWEGAIGWGVKGVGFGIKKGDYKSIYY